jgi:phage terminase large subunit
VTPERVILFEPRKEQWEIHEQLQRARFGVVVCHRRLGKTVLAVNELIRGAMRCSKEAPRFGYLAPTYRQGKATAWDYLKRYSAPVQGRLPNESELRIDFANGGQVRIYGADNPDSLRGLYFDGIVLDEYGLHPPQTYSEVIAPALVDRGGWALFMGTPNGKNQFWEIAQHAKQQQAAGDKAWFFQEYKVSDTKLLDAHFLSQAKAVMTSDEYAQEFECNWEAAIKGAIYSKELEAVRADGRITSVSYNPALPVDTDWDLGIGDSTAIWFSQSLRSGEIRLIDYYEASGEGFPFYAKMLSERGYVYGKHWAPHDIEVRELGSGLSRKAVAAEHGIRFERTPRLTQNVGQEVEEGIHAVRMILPRCWFDAVKCQAGLEALMSYRRDYNERLAEFKASPVHDWASHGADAFRGLAVRHRVPEEKKQRERTPMPMKYTWS